MQNCCIWSSENPRVIVEEPLYPQRVTVCCGLWSGGVIGPYFFENEAGATVTVNGLRYRVMINDFLWPKLDGIDLDNVYFQQETIDLLREKFPDRVIFRRGDQNWPPTSCDLTPCDFFLQGHEKEKVYANSPASIQDLKYSYRGHRAATSRFGYGKKWHFSSNIKITPLIGKPFIMKIGVWYW